MRQTDVAILHYTALPATGGVERYIDEQARALLSLGCSVRVIVGAGMGPSGSATTTIPAMLPDAPVKDRAALAAELGQALEGASHVWVHNILSLSLHPLLRSILEELMRDSPARWTAWCEDLSASSRFVADRTAPLATSRLGFATISHTRAADIARATGMETADIAVVPPPLDILSWLGISDEVAAIWDELCLDRRTPLVLVPAKLLPHKNLLPLADLALALRAVAGSPYILVTGAPSPHEPAVSVEVRRELQNAVSALGVQDDVHVLSTPGRSLSRRAVRELMMLADLVFLPSLEEGYGLPVLEAAAVRCPVLCSDIPAFREAGDRFARYIAPDAPLAVASAVIEICQEAPNEARRRAARSRLVFRDQLRALL